MQGWVAEVEGHDCVVCPYHGWAFDGEGVLQDVPAAENQKEWPRKQLVQSYPVKEKVPDAALSCPDECMLLATMNCPMLCLPALVVPMSLAEGKGYNRMFPAGVIPCLLCLMPGCLLCMRTTQLIFRSNEAQCLCHSEQTAGTLRD